MTQHPVKVKKQNRIAAYLSKLFLRGKRKQNKQRAESFVEGGNDVVTNDVADDVIGDKKSAGETRWTPRRANKRTPPPKPRCSRQLAAGQLAAGQLVAGQLAAGQLAASGSDDERRDDNFVTSTPRGGSSGDESTSSNHGESPTVAEDPSAIYASIVGAHRRINRQRKNSASFRARSCFHQQQPDNHHQMARSQWRSVGNVSASAQQRLCPLSARATSLVDLGARGLALHRRPPSVSRMIADRCHVTPVASRAPVTDDLAQRIMRLTADVERPKSMFESSRDNSDYVVLTPTRDGSSPSRPDVSNPYLYMAPAAGRARSPPGGEQVNRSRSRTRNISRKYTAAYTSNDNIHQLYTRPASERRREATGKENGWTQRAEAVGKEHGRSQPASVRRGEANGGANGRAEAAGKEHGWTQRRGEATGRRQPASDRRSVAIGKENGGGDDRNYVYLSRAPDRSRPKSCHGRFAESPRRSAPVDGGVISTSRSSDFYHLNLFIAADDPAAPSSGREKYRSLERPKLQKPKILYSLDV